MTKFSNLLIVESLDFFFQSLDWRISWLYFPISRLKSLSILVSNLSIEQSLNFVFTFQYLDWRVSRLCLNFPISWLKSLSTLFKFSNLMIEESFNFIFQSPWLNTDCKVWCLFHTLTFSFQALLVRAILLTPILQPPFNLTLRVKK